MSNYFEVVTKSPADIGTHFLELQGEVQGLAKDQEETFWFDGAILSFEIGKESDLSDGERIDHELDSGIFTDEGDTGTSFVDGLDEGTEYYFKAITNPVDVRDASLMETAASRGGFMKDAADNETFMDKVTDSEIAMDKVTDKEMPMDKVTDSEVAMNKVMADAMLRTKMLLSPHIIDTMWNKVIGVEKFALVHELKDSNSNWVSINELPSQVVNHNGGLEIYVDVKADDGKYVISFEVDSADNPDSWVETIRAKYDLTNVNEIKFERKQVGDMYTAMWVDGERMTGSWTGGEDPTDWEVQTADVYAISGEVYVGFGYSQWGTTSLSAWSGIRNVVFE